MCSLASQGYYSPLGYENASSQATTKCELCLEGAMCPWNERSAPLYWQSGLRDLQIAPNFWRLTAESDDIMECVKGWESNTTDTPCTGGGPSACLANHTGPLCKVRHNVSAAARLSVKPTHTCPLSAGLL